ncbi:UNVERIFIED_ORG: hypothetical protein GGD51_005023 [Rhizobium esperanzae]|nr:hypothetical protein RLPCCGM1_p0706 [Rhizobium leguminosarum bv. phaseoli CCGM1]
MDDAEEDVLAYMTFPKEHRAKLHSTNPIERLNGEIKRRTEVVGIFPNDEAIVRLVGALLLEQNDEWAVQRARYMTLETMAQMSDDPQISLPRCGTLIFPSDPCRESTAISRDLHHLPGHDRITLYSGLNLCRQRCDRGHSEPACGYSGRSAFA